MIIEAIYDLEPQTMTDGNKCVIKLRYQDRIYIGSATIHPNDKEFFSEKVGFNIALSRARIKIMEDVYKEAKQEALFKNRMLKEATNFGQLDISTIDPTGNFRAKVDKANKRAKKIRDALIKERKGQSIYIGSLKSMIESVRNLRAKKNN